MDSGSAADRSASIVAETTDRLRPLSQEAALAAWEVNVEANEENERRRIAADLARLELLGDREVFGRIEHALDGDAEPLVRRQLELLRDGFLPHQVPEELSRRIVELEAAVETRFLQHRGVVDGRGAERQRAAPPVADQRRRRRRREAWEASKTVGAAVADDVRQLARLRNEAAQALGHRDWFALSVATSEMDEDRLFATLAEADDVTSGPFAAWKRALDERLAERFGCGVDELRPWHYDDPFFQEVPADGGVDLDFAFEDADLLELTRRTFDGIGIETRPIIDRSDLFPRDAKCQHAFCTDIDREGDIRVLANVEPSAYWMDTMLHELGHGVYDAGIDTGLPWLVRSTHLVTTEGIAIMFGRLHRDAEWLAQVAGLSSDAVADLAPRLQELRAAETLVFARWVLVMTNFERALYADPEGDLTSTWWELVHRFQGVNPPDDRNEPDWAAKIHVALAPVYYHNYLYGAIVASQLREALDREAGGLVDRPEAGRILTERLFSAGDSSRWDELVERATGAPLQASSLRLELAASSAVACCKATLTTPCRSG